LPTFGTRITLLVVREGLSGGTRVTPCFSQKPGSTAF